MSYTSDGQVVLVDGRSRLGTDVYIYKTPLEMVLALMNSGVIGRVFYGDDAHVAALDAIETQLAKVRAAIEDERARETAEVEQ